MTVLSPAEKPARPTPNLDAYTEAAEAVRKLGRRAERACELSAGGGLWSPASVRAAAQGLEEGARAVGVTRRWPRLAASLKRISTLWAAKRLRVSP